LTFQPLEQLKCWQNNTLKENNMTKKYKVLGMTCAGCANSVSNALKAAAPEASVDVDLNAKEVSVEGIAEDSIVRQAVEGAGFEYGGPA